ncbi:MAG: hypothetical protein LBF22_03065 [Deltaproteobacteria bacterium]|nr:hypothetical protein [Deltaproteobacteria bacterium]
MFSLQALLPTISITEATLAIRNNQRPLTLRVPHHHHICIQTSIPPTSPTITHTLSMHQLNHKKAA